MFAIHDLEALHDHDATPVLDMHLLLQQVATPALGLTAAVLAGAVARAAGTVPAWVLAGFAVIGGVGYAAAGPVIVKTVGRALPALVRALSVAGMAATPALLFDVNELGRRDQR